MAEKQLLKTPFYLKSFVKYALLIFIPLIAIETAVYTLVCHRDFENAKKDLLITEMNKLELLEEIITGAFSGVISNVMIIAENPDFQLMLETNFNEHRSRFIEFLKSFAERKLLYDHIRFLDERGYEKIRVNLNQYRSVVVPENKLQYKGERPYFKEIIGLSRNEIYVSPLELNIENSSIEIPYKPVIRFGIPVFDRFQKRGAVILNAYGFKLLQKPRWPKAALRSRVYLLNDEGFWLSSPDSTDEWGFMLDERKERNFYSRYSSVRDVMYKSDAGQVFSEYGLVTYRTIYPLKIELIDESIRLYNADNYRWKLVLNVSPEILAAMSEENIRKFMFSYAALFVVILFVSVFWSLSISKRRLAEKKLAENEEQFRLLAENATDMISRHLPDCAYIYASPICKIITGYEPEELYGNEAYEYIHSEDVESVRIAQDKMAHEDAVCTVNYRFRKKDGSFLWVETTSKTIFDEKTGKAGEIIAVTRDISERKQAEEALQRSEEKYRGLFESSREGIVFNNSEGFYLECNRAFLEMTGYPLEELKLMNYQMITPPQWRKIDEEMVQDQLMNRGYTDEYEKELIKKDGSKFSIELQRWLIRDSNGKPAGLWAIIRDITQHKKLEEERTRAERLRGVLEMAGAASHELNQPMQVISGYAELLLNKKQNDNELERQLKIIIKQIERLADMTRKLQGITRYETKDYIEGIKIIDIDRASVKKTWK